MRVKMLVSLFLFAAVLVSPCASGQGNNQTRIAVVVTDSEGAVVAHAGIRLTAPPDRVVEIATDGIGQAATQLAPGGYTLSVTVPGFRQYARYVDVQSLTEEQIFPVVLQVAHVDGMRVSGATTVGEVLRLANDSHAPVALTLAELKAMPHITATFHNTHTNADETYSGVRLSDLLSKVGAPLGSELRGEALTNFVVATGADGYQAILALAEIDPSFHPGEVLVADTMNGKPLDAHSGPLKLVVTEDKRPARSVRNLTSIELRFAQ